MARVTAGQQSIFALVLSLGAGAPACVDAAPAKAPTAVHIEVRARNTADALVQLGLQTGSTIGGPVLCEGPPVSLQGDFTLAQALDRVLAASNCGYRLVDGHTARTFLAKRLSAPSTRPVALKAPPPSSDAQDTMVEDVRVVGVKRPYYAGRLPGSVTVIGRPRLIDTSATDTDSIARQTASFTTTNLGPARNKILLRGLSDGAFTGRTQSTVGTYLDDVPVTYDAPDPDLRLVDVQTVEILRGPQGALYGGGSLSGVYRIVTRKPQLDRTSATFNLLAASTAGGAGSSQADVTVNLALAPGRLALRMSAYNDREGGYLHDEALRLANVDVTERSGGRAALLWQLNDQWAATLSSAVQRLNSADTQYVTNGPRRRANQVREAHRNDFSEVAATLAGSGDWGRLNSTLSYVSHDFASRYDATSVVTAFGGDGDSIGVFDEGTRNRMGVADAYWSSPESAHWRFMAGGFASSASERLPSTLESRAGATQPRPLYSEIRRDVRLEAAIYGEAAYDAGGGWSFVSGMRGFSTRIGTSSSVDTPVGGPPRSLEKAARFSGLAPKISVQKSWGADRSVYALWSSGYRAGGFNAGGLLAPTPERTTFAPDRLQNLEVGGHYASDGRRVRLDGALFYARWTHLQTDQYLRSGLSYTANVGTGANLGLEGELSFEPGKRWLLQANALIDSPQIVSLDPGSTAVVGASLPSVPKVALSGLLTRELPLGPRRSLLLTGEAAYTGGSRLTFDPRYSPKTDGYVSANLSAQVVGERARIGILVSNPMNSSSDTFSYGNPFSFGQVRQATPQRPRTIAVKLSSAF